MFTTNEKIIQRPQYENVLLETLETNSIKVLTGIRRCGKSTLLKSFREYLSSKKVPKENLVYIKLDSYEAPLNPDAEWLDDFLQTHLNAANQNSPFYVFLDEVQEIPGWEKPIRRLYETIDTHIYLTGSNANMLSSDLATYLSGRYIEIKVYPLSYIEFCSFADQFELLDTEGFTTPENTFNTYLRFGGMPGLFTLSDFTDITVSRELEAIHDTVLLNDVAKRFNIRDVDLLEKLLRYVYTTSGNLFSTNKVAGALTSMGRKTNSETIDSYLNALMHAFALHKCQQLGLKGKALLQPQKKYYAPDTGLRNLESGFMMQDIGFQLENLVYIELLRRGYDVHVGSLQSKEIDFIAQRLDQRIYIQVCNSMLDDNTREREISPLEELNDSFPKLVLVRDKASAGTTSSGIQIIPLIDWLNC